MSDCDEDAIGNPDVDTDLNIETSTETKTTTTTCTPGGALRVLLANVFTSPQISSVGTSFPNPPAAPPFSRSSSQSNQHALVTSEILPRLFISDIFTALNAATLRSFSITHIISVIEYAVAFPTISKPSSESESRVFPGSFAEYPTPLSPLNILHVPLADFPGADIFSYFTITRDFITTSLKDENARVLVHCYKGQSRSPTIVAAYLISTLKISTSDAVKMIQAKRPMVLPNRGFRRQLEQWEVMVKEEDEMACTTSKR